MKYFSYVNTAITIIGLYSGRQPFHVFIKGFFRQHKKYGSADRKQITHLCYCYFRLGQAIKNTPPEERMIIGLFLGTQQNNEILASIKPAWNEIINLPVEEKCAFINFASDIKTIFPCAAELSDGIDKNNFMLSHLLQPDLFLRIRPGRQQTVINKLTAAGIDFSWLPDKCIRLPNTTKVDDLLQINKEAVIQDFSSQRTGSFLQTVTAAPGPVKIWDCCAGSGGKSIMANDILEDIDLTVSDIRKTVLANLKKRFYEAGILQYKTLLTDLTKPGSDLKKTFFDLILADAPCTGSGTWGRTPERLSFFDENEIDVYSALQKKIINTTMSCLKSGGHFLYITCSVFKKENEQAADFIQKNFAVELVKMEVLKGYDMKADTLFAALFRKY